ncbi:hypothetical protein [Streptomyces tubercidicus]|uniref:hypothetical protein n=1 Tax=Streptomyces tubercidicus TaxID=47759 RepID=UPI002E1475A3|nr:hypothetical protein OG761_21555 [Streptomyces tubercidicus]
MSILIAPWCLRALTAHPSFPEADLLISPAAALAYLTGWMILAEGGPLAATRR